MEHMSQAPDATKEQKQASEVLQVPPPYPNKLKMKDNSRQFKKFLDVLKQLHINILFVEALEQIPSYMEFLKDIIFNKRRLDEFETVVLTHECSALFKNSISVKLKDLGSFILPCSIRGKEVGHALCVLCASINLMSLSIFKKLGIGEAKPTTVTLQLADRSITHPEGKSEDVLVQVDKFIFLVDFIILDYEADAEIPIILGHPFLATGRALIDVRKGELTIPVDDQQVKFNVFYALRYPDELETCQCIDVADIRHWELLKKELKEEEKGLVVEEVRALITLNHDFEPLNLTE
ncbi:uncharacterized protein LOC120069437 [Benincasa hispida]|uniref:uncharacterized protein LOC120069437 n=1 Tax=Benincasa hispida TaxID=102211 RepID=UPI001900DB97|nr:uncharacterized protein LOC120069437 [Benincasa hispida]